MAEAPQVVVSVYYARREIQKAEGDGEVMRRHVKEHFWRPSWIFDLVSPQPKETRKAWIFLVRIVY